MPAKEYTQALETLKIFNMLIETHEMKFLTDFHTQFVYL